MFRDHYQPHLPPISASTTCASPRCARRRRRWPGRTVSRRSATGTTGSGPAAPGTPVRRGPPLRAAGLPVLHGMGHESWTGIWHGRRDKILMEQSYRASRLRRPLPRGAARAVGSPAPDGGREASVLRVPPGLAARRAAVHGSVARAGVPGRAEGAVPGGRGPPAVGPLAAGFDASVDTGLFPLVGWKPWTRRENAFATSGSAHAPPDHLPLRRRVRELREPPGGSPAARHEPRPPASGWDNTPAAGGRPGPPWLDAGALSAAGPAGPRPGRGRTARAPARLPQVVERVAEGNYMEPDVRFGKGYLEALRDEVRLD